MEILKFFTKKESKNVAKDRLKVVLIHDRALVPEPVMEEMKSEIMEVVSKYVDIDRAGFNFEISASKENARRASIVANIPLKNKKSEI